MKWFGINLPNRGSYVSYRFNRFHDYILLWLFYIASFVVLILHTLVNNRFIVKKMGNLQALEFVWTLFPCLILICIGIPSIFLLYSYDYEGSGEWGYFCIKVVARQWYWTYNYSGFEGVEFDSYIKLVEDLELGEFRLIEVDNRLVVPYGVHIRFIVTSRDVIHSWALPALGLKVDANPGYLNRLNITLRVPGLYYGQCSEICGANHRFIPIGVEVTRPVLFKVWLFSIL